VECRELWVLEREWEWEREGLSRKASKGLSQVEQPAG
jgi:hypothetical protein